MRKSEEPPETRNADTKEPQVRSAFLRQEAGVCQWPDGFTPELEVDDPAIKGLAEQLWLETKQILEDNHERLNRQVFNTAVERATSEVFAASDVGIKQLAAAKRALQDSWASIDGACEFKPAQEREEAHERPVLTARLESTPASQLPQSGNATRLAISLGDVSLAVELHIPKQSWIYRAYERLTEGFDNLEARMRTRPVGRLGMMTDDRELTMGLRYVRQPNTVIEVGGFRRQGNGR